MMEKFRNKYRIKSDRAEWWDYGNNGVYFITICTHQRLHYFGEIIDKKMKLSPIGITAEILWYEIPNHTDHIKLGPFVVMPNHIHGILILDKPSEPVFPVETLHATSLPIKIMVPDQTTDSEKTSDENQISTKNEFMSSISPKPQSISCVIISYKSAVTKHANRCGLEHGWQTRFYDHIIRNHHTYQRISNYIIKNPENWSKDRFCKRT